MIFAFGIIQKMILLYYMVILYTMNKRTCGYCYSDKHIISFQQMFACMYCKKTINRCDICNLYCHNMCLKMFDSMLSLNSV